MITSLQTGGAEHLLVDLLPLLRDDGRNVVELLVFNGVPTPFMDELKGKGLTVHQLSMDKNVYNPLNIFRLLRFIGKYDIIHTHNTACQLFVPIAALMRHKSGLLATTEHSSNNRRRNMKWCKPIDSWMYSRYAAVVCIADQPRRNLEDYIGKKKNIYTILNGVDVSRFLHPLKDISHQSGFIVTMVAGLRVEKDHETVLRAMRYLPENYHLQLVGDGIKKDGLKELTRELNLEKRVDFLGMRLDVPDILEQSDIVVLSSHWEGLSLSSIEGMASGRPFIASDVDGLREMVGGAGVLFTHGDDKDLAEKIQWLCEHPDKYRQVATRCQEKAKQYDISVMARK